MEGCQHYGHHYDRSAYDVVEHPCCRRYAFAKLEAMCCSSGAIVRALFLIVQAIGIIQYERYQNEHHDPHLSTDKERMDPTEGGHLPFFMVECHQACDEDDHIEDKRHIHVDVDHPADHFAPTEAQAPVISCIVVNPEGHSEKEDKVGENEVEHSDGGDGCRAGLHDVYHQAKADGTGEQNHRVDGQEDCVVLIMIFIVRTSECGV